MNKTARAILALALPGGLAQLGFMSLIAVDVAMITPLGKAALAAVALASAYASLASWIGWYLLSPISVLVARALGAGDRETAGRVFHAGIGAALCLSVAYFLLLRFPWPIIRLLAGTSGPSSELTMEAVAFTQALAWSAPGFLIMSVARCYLEGQSRPWPLVWIATLGTLANAVADQALIFGRFGLPALGVAGAAWATVAVETTRATMMLVYIGLNPDLRPRAWARPVVWFGTRTMGQILGPGLPLAIRIGVREVSMVVIVGMVRRLGTAALAAHQIGLSLHLVFGTMQWATLYATSVLVATHRGRRDMVAARHTIRWAYAVALTLVAIPVLVLLLLAHPIAMLYSGDPAVVAATSKTLRGVALCGVSAAFFATGLGGLSGFLDTKFVAFSSSGAQVGVMLALGWVLAFAVGLGPAGFWVARAVGEFIAAGLFHLRLRHRLRQVPASMGQA